MYPIYFSFRKKKLSARSEYSERQNAQTISERGSSWCNFTIPRFPLVKRSGKFKIKRRIERERERLGQTIYIYSPSLLLPRNFTSRHNTRGTSLVARVRSFSVFCARSSVEAPGLPRRDDDESHPFSLFFFLFFFFRHPHRRRFFFFFARDCISARVTYFVASCARASRRPRARGKLKKRVRAFVVSARMEIVYIREYMYTHMRNRASVTLRKYV